VALGTGAVSDRGCGGSSVSEWRGGGRLVGGSDGGAIAGAGGSLGSPFH
jgi:hypothetical protein